MFKTLGVVQALVNVGAEVVKTVPGRVSTEVDARLAYDTPGIVNEASCLSSKHIIVYALKPILFAI